MKFARVFTVFVSFLSFLTFTFGAFAQEASDSVSKGGGGSSSALPDAGGSLITYAIFVGGLVLFLVVSINLVASLVDQK